MAAAGAARSRGRSTPGCALPYDAKIKDSVRKDCASEIDIEQFYAGAQARGYEYGPSFRGLKRISCNGAVLFGEAELPATVAHHEAKNAGLDPRLLDACLQLMIQNLPLMESAGETADGRSEVYLPARIGRVIISGFPKGRAAVRAKATYSLDQNEIQADFLIGDVGAEASIRIDGLVARPISLGRPSCSSEPGQPSFYTEVFEPAPLSDVKANGVGAAMPGRWLIISLRDSRIASAIRRSLVAFGEDAACIRLDKKASVKEDAYRSALADALSDRPAKAIIYALPLDSNASLSFEDVPSALGDHALRLTAFGRALAACPVADDCSLVWIVTRHARSIGPADSPPASGLAQSGLIGLARAIAVECPEHELRLLDVDMPACLKTNRIAAAITKGWRESEILIRGEKVFVPRLRQRRRDDLPPRIAPLRRLPPNRNFVLCRPGPTGPDSLAWQEQSQSNLQRNHVRVEVRAAGLNFRDVMAVGGLLPEDAEVGRPLDALGLEFAGVVREAGPDMSDMHIGERVFGMTRGSFRRFLDVPADRLHAIPATLTDEAAAALPSAYLTAHYALNTLARISANDRVLIHNASGGVGLAAIALAKLAGAEIFATAGTDAKRSFLRQQGIRHVMDSRSLAFADEVMAMTDGAGVDVVLNSLPSPYMEKGLTCLAPYGRFLELGKRDIYADSALGLRALRSNISFHVIDLAALIEERPQSARLLMRELLTLIEDGRLEPLPVISFTAGEIADAFRYFAGARQIGKIAVSFGDAELPIRRNLSAGSGLDRNGCYLVTGGTDGFGFEVGLWLAGRGAGHVVLASRTGAVSPENAERVEELVTTGAKIEFASLDVADFGQVRLFIDRFAGSGETLRGVIHAAAVYDDALLPDLTAEKFDRVLAPKVRGSVNLTRAIKDSRCSLDFFVSFSSLAQVVGWTGQASYAAANSFLRALVDWQRLEGIPGQCINWGVFREAGHVARNGKMISYMSNAGWVALDNDQALAALAVALDIDSPELTYGAADWTRLAANHKPLRTTARLSELLAKGEHRSKASMQRLNRSNGGSQLAEAEQVVRAQAGKVLRIDVDTLRSCRTLDEAGLDSLSTFELKSRIESELGLIVPFGRYMKAASFDELAELVCDLVNEARR